MHVPSVSDYKTNRGGPKKKKEEKLHRLENPTSPTNAKIEFLDITFLSKLSKLVVLRRYSTNLRTMRINEVPFIASQILIQFGFNQFL